ncbi:hypothetical protein M3Y97_00224900 [Aphelenchoides bicaudatus]|nr:hypothetical protein M3Y97_00224900 [Aphelenchoides bicaudatus]
MYRVLSAQKVDLYCVRNNCNFNCGLFHTPEARRNAKKSLRDRRAKQFRVKSLDMGSLKNDKKQEVRTANSDEPPKTNFLGIQPNAIEPMTPLPLSGASTVTLEDIISSAKRKISQEYIDLRIKSPELNDSDTEMHHLAKQRNLIGGTPWPKDIYLTDESDHKEDVSYVEHLINSSSDEEEWVDKNPPSIIEDGDIDEDFEEVLKAAQPPPDHYSNPLYRKGR